MNASSCRAPAPSPSRRHSAAFCPDKRRKTLVVANGAYGDRAAKILERIGRPYCQDRQGRQRRPDGRGRDGSCSMPTRRISHVWIDPLRDHLRHRQSDRRDRPARSRTRGKVFMVDAMSSFGALPLDMVGSEHRCDGVLLQQVHRGRAGILLCAVQARPARSEQGPMPFDGARPLRAVDGPRDERPVPLHAADPCARRLPSGAQGA